MAADFIPNSLITVVVSADITANLERSADNRHRLVVTSVLQSLTNDPGEVYGEDETALYNNASIQLRGVSEHVARILKMSRIVSVEVGPSVGAGGGGGSFPAGPATVTCSDIDLEGFNTSFSLALGDGTIHSWSWGNNAGSGGNDNFIDSGGGPDSDTIATRIETRINALAINVIVLRVLNSLTISSSDGLVVYSSDGGAVVT